MGWQKNHKHKLTVQSPSSLQVPEAKGRWLHYRQADMPYRNNLRSSKAWGRRISAPRKFLDKRNVFDGIKKNKLASNVGMDNQHLGEIAWSNLQNKKHVQMFQRSGWWRQWWWHGAEKTKVLSKMMVITLMMRAMEMIESKSSFKYDVAAPCCQWNKNLKGSVDSKSWDGLKALLRSSCYPLNNPGAEVRLKLGKKPYFYLPNKTTLPFGSSSNL